MLFPGLFPPSFRENGEVGLYFEAAAASVPIAAGILYPFTGLLLSPMIAGAAMAFSSVSVIANALRLNRLSI